eukprot:CAMPEP_0176492748 /NCGR_PEP_ID=MMETSP0200_2-20121128/9174_1 /TAXON_ID=947934 /ORGANISM="Chaetoceros sp., Strain GSL56" /LENGTH=1143 /DNA_ID=CAMNT_0017890351 /DNA_START=55 /DNA_END=3486 /DNA_ORIENTATION=-
MSDNQSSKELYYEEVLTTAALALSQSKRDSSTSSGSRGNRSDSHGRIRLRNSPHSDHTYARSDTYNFRNNFNSSMIKSDRTNTSDDSENRVCQSDGGSNSVWRNRDLPTCHGLSQESFVFPKDGNDEMMGQQTDPYSPRKKETNTKQEGERQHKSQNSNNRFDSGHGDEKHFMLAPTDVSDLLASLPSRPIANFPSESDRKRIIGMLATIISTMYQYEQDDEVMDYSPITISLCSNTQQQQEQEPEENEEEEKVDPTTVRSISTMDTASSSSPNSGPDVENVDESSPSAMNDPDENTTYSDERQTHSVTNHNHNRRNNNRLLSRRQSSSFHSPSPVQNKEQSKKENIIGKRYRQRRHSVYSNFLVSAAGFLFLDKSNAIAFLPLLNKLLGTDDIDENVFIESWNRRVSARNGYKNNDPDLQQYLKGNQDMGTNNRQRQGRDGKQKTNDCDKQPWHDNDILMPFVESLEQGAGVQCLSLLLLNYLLQSQQGYDARIRACVKKLGVIIFSHELKHSDCEEVQERLKLGIRMGRAMDDCLIEMATRKFESLEHTIASKLLRISAAQQQRKEENDNAVSNVGRTRREITRDKIIRGLKIGTAGVAAGTLLAVTGGLAAPGIAAGLAATGITTAATAGVVTTLTSTAAVTTIFGVGGGGLAAYKTHRRTKGVTEFTFQKQQHDSIHKDEGNAELFTTICISGWLKDEKDFERPWGIEPSNPPITDKLEKLVRFYSIHKPGNIGRCQEILNRWKGEEKELWAVLREKYGQDPDHLYPIYSSPNKRIVLTHEEDEVVDRLLGELGYTVPHEDQSRSALREVKQKLYSMNVNDSSILMRSTQQSENVNASFSTSISDTDNSQYYDQDSRRRANQIWDYKVEYGGELVTVKWESELLVELCDSVADMAADMAGQAAREILKQTALATLITAVALPYAIVRAADMIDGTWTLAIERSDLAGIELANSLLESEAGHRPVVLIGYSMGARVIYSCLKELARQQEIWEEQEECMRTGLGKNKERRHRKKLTREPASIVEDAIIMGLPNHLSLHSWESCRRVVAGRLVNCYSKKDMILSLMFQIKRLTGVLRPVCGTSPVRVKGIENYNVETLISAHSDYCAATGHILRVIYHGTPHRSSATIVVPSYATNQGYRMT